MSSTDKNPSKSERKKNDMAFVAPVVRKDYPIFMSAPVERKKSKTPRPKDSGIEATGSQQSENRKRMEQHKQRRARRYPKKKAKIVLRKISEINEENEEELHFDQMQKGFTRLRRVTECSESEEEQREPSPEVSPQPQKKKLFGLFVWKPFSFRKKGSRPEAES